MPPIRRLFGQPRSNNRGAVRANESGQFNLVYHGTMVHRLGVDLIIRAVSQLRERIPNLHLHLWGGGDDLDAFEGLASDLGLRGRVTFKPQGFPLQQLSDQLRLMDVGVVGNRRSVAADLMLPVKLMEYVALGIPAVVPRLPAIAHYFTDNMVSYYEPESVEALADSVFRLYRATRPPVLDRPRRPKRCSTCAGGTVRDPSWSAFTRGWWRARYEQGSVCVSRVRQYCQEARARPASARSTKPRLVPSSTAICPGRRSFPASSGRQPSTAWAR